MRTRHKTRYPGIMYRLVDEEKPDGDRRYVVWYQDSNKVGRTETLPLGSTLEDARLRQSELKVRKSQGERIVPTKMTVGDLLDRWLDSRRADLKPTTVTAYEWAVSTVKGYIQHRRITEIGPADIVDLRRRLKDGKKTWTVKKIETPLKAAFQMAVREGWVSSNPYSKLLPQERLKGDQAEKRCMGRDEIPKLLEAASSDRWRTLFALLTFTGLRISEALALTWEDVDLEEGLIHVRESKTDAGVRSVMAIDALCGLLRAWKLKQAPGHQFCFSNASGDPVSRREALRALRAAEKRADLPNYTLHELRHTFASILIDQGEQPTLIADQMGHANPKVTLEVYAHLFDAKKNVEEARERLQASFGRMV